MGRRGHYFYYTTPPQICQVENVTKNQKMFFPKLCILMIDFWTSMVYNGCTR